MSCRTTALALAACVVLMQSALTHPSPAHAESAPEAELVRAYDLAYNLDFDEAVSHLEGLVAEYPADPAPHRGIAALTWLRMLFLRGAILVDAQLTATVRAAGMILDPPEELEDLFEEHIEIARELAEEGVDDRPDDADAHYELGAAVALQASYKASIEGDGLRALRDAKRAYESHERVLELDPERHDAGFTLGLYRYLVSLLPRAFRMMAYLVGFDGGREEALRLIENAAAHPGETENEAKFALVLLYNRERKYDQASGCSTTSSAAFPRNRLVWLESASTWLRDDRPHMAARDLSLGFSKLESDDRPRMLAEEEMWYLKRGTARVALRQPDEARADLEVARAADAKGWVHQPVEAVRGHRRGGPHTLLREPRRRDRR